MLLLKFVCMTARPCPECGGLVASTISHCPHCGHQLGSDMQHSTTEGENPHSSLARVVIAIILFWPFGLVSLYYYIKSDDRWDCGNKAGAELYGRYSRRFAKYAIYAVLIAFVIGIFFPFVCFGIFS